MKYRCRTTKPIESEWYDQEAEMPEQAANEFHSDRFDTVRSIQLTVHPTPEERYEIHFAGVEVEGHGEWVSRIFRYGIWRRGGVVRAGTPTFEQRLAEIVKILGWTHDPMELLDDDCFEYVEPARSPYVDLK